MATALEAAFWGFILMLPTAQKDLLRTPLCKCWKISICTVVHSQNFQRIEIYLVERGEQKSVLLKQCMHRFHLTPVSPISKFHPLDALFIFVLVY